MEYTCGKWLFQNGGNNTTMVELKVLMPDRNIVTVTINRTATTDNVYQVCLPTNPGLSDIILLALEGLPAQNC